MLNVRISSFLPGRTKYPCRQRPKHTQQRFPPGLGAIQFGRNRTWPTMYYAVLMPCREAALLILPCSAVGMIFTSQPSRRMWCIRQTYLACGEILSHVFFCSPRIHLVRRRRRERGKPKRASSARKGGLAALTAVKEAQQGRPRRSAS